MCDITSTLFRGRHFDLKWDKAQLLTITFYFFYVLESLKGVVYRKISTHHYSNGGVSEVFETTKHFSVSGVNVVAAEFDSIKATRDVYLRCSKTTANATCLHTARVVSSKCMQALTFIFDSKQPYLHHVFSLNVRWYLPMRYVHAPLDKPSCCYVHQLNHFQWLLGFKKGVNALVSNRMCSLCVHVKYCIVFGKQVHHILLCTCPLVLCFMSMHQTQQQKCWL